jgi:hypothetical protein
MLGKEKRDVKKTNRSYRSIPERSQNKEILPNCELDQERFLTPFKCL